MSDVLDRILRQRQGKAGMMVPPSGGHAAALGGDRVVQVGSDLANPLSGGHASPAGDVSNEREHDALLRAAGAESDAEGTDDFGAFGWLRGTKERAVMLELRKKTGAILAVGYSWIEFIEFDPSDGITLWIPGRKVRIQGRNLNMPADPERPNVRLFEGLTRHRVPWVQELEASTTALTSVEKILY